MTDKNSIDKIEYIPTNIYWAIFACALYQMTAFTPVPGIGVTKSRILMWSMTMIMSILGTAITYSKRRNYVSVVVNVTLPLEIFSFMSYGKCFGVWATATIIAASVLGVSFFFAVMSRKISQEVKSKAKIIKSRLRHAALGTRTVAVVCMLAFLVPLTVDGMFFKNFEEAKVSKEAFAEYSEYTIENKIETIMQLKDETWETLTDDEKLAVLTVVKNIEMRYFGITFDVSLAVKDLREGIAGEYSHGEKIIFIDKKVFEIYDAESLIHVLLHECYHVNQSQQVEIYDQASDAQKNSYIFRWTRVYKEEFYNYVDASEDKEKYRAQLCEIHANEYAYSAINEYLSAIAEHENEKSSTKIAAKGTA